MLCTTVEQPSANRVLQHGTATPVLTDAPWEELFSSLSSKWPQRVKASLRKRPNDKQGDFQMIFTKLKADDAPDAPAMFLVDNAGRILDADAVMRRDYRRVRLVACDGQTSAHTMYDARNLFKNASADAVHAWKIAAPNDIVQAVATLPDGLQAVAQFTWSSK